MQMTRNILKVYRLATTDEHDDGLTWYPRANALATDIANGDTLRGSGVLASFSPLTPWWRNVELATDSLRTGIARTDTLGNSSRAAQRIIDGESPYDVLRGPKTRAFCENIHAAGVSDNVTVDVHAASIARGVAIPSSAMKLNKTQYAEIADCYRRAAAREGIAVTALQAVTWVAWRRMHPNKAAQRAA